MSAKKEKPTTANSNHPSTLKAARRCLAIGLISAAIAVAIACEEEEYVGHETISPNWITSCERTLQFWLMQNRETETAETANQAIAKIQEVRSEICGPTAWAPKVSAEPQSCHLSIWKDGTATPPILAEAARTDTDGITRGPELNTIVAFAEKPTGKYEAKCWLYIEQEHRWIASLDE